jgi:hypothetical protein
MIHIMLPEQYLQQAASRLVEPRKRLMLAVLMTAVDDCQNSMHRRPAGHGSSSGRRALSDALAYISSTDRTWAFSFENLCDAVGVDAGSLRRALQQAAAAA